MIRKLILEALEARSLLKHDAVHGETGEHDAHGKTFSKDRIAEEIAVYGRADEADAQGIWRETPMFLTVPSGEWIRKSCTSGTSWN